jgi:formate-dependent nitrite reductase membrane component NrfD
MPSDMTEFTFQTEWVAKRGFFLVLAFFLGGLGAGLYLMSMYFNFYPGMVTGFLIVLIGKGGAHLVYLGRPLRAWRGFLKPQTSWISRGLISIVVFLIPTALHLASTLFNGLPWNSHNLAIQVFIVIGALALMAYTGFALASVKAIRSWNTSMMPVLFIAYSILGGTGLTMGMLAGLGENTELASVEAIAVWMLVAVAALMGIYVWTTYNTNRSGKQSMLEMMKGRTSPYFLLGVVILGLVIPLIVAVYALLSHVPSFVVVGASVCEIIGGFSMRYSIFKSGAYAPIMYNRIDLI